MWKFRKGWCGCRKVFYVILFVNVKMVYGSIWILQFGNQLSNERNRLFLTAKYRLKRSYFSGYSTERFGTLCLRHKVSKISIIQVPVSKWLHRLFSSTCCCLREFAEPKVNWSILEVPKWPKYLGTVLWSFTRKRSVRQKFSRDERLISLRVRVTTEKPR